MDTLWNIENLRFCIHDDPVLKTCDAFTDVSVAPRVALSATSLAFGNQAIGSTSATRNVTVTNTGIAALKVTSVTVTGTDPGQFTATPAAGCASIAAGGSCLSPFGSSRPRRAPSRRRSTSPTTPQAARRPSL